ncbi:MAG: hypothetical protein KY396_06885, partial [Actinobacteria bacterium]|nr:hypothetical protein [Actinomycetota bacterium]
MRAALAGQRARGRPQAALFRAFLAFSLLVGFTLLGVLLVDVVRKGIGHLDLQFLTSAPSSQPEEAGARPAILATIYMMGLLILFRSEER